MTNLAAEPVFVDTNVLVYAGVGSAPLHVEVLDVIRDFQQARAVLWISRQILREYLAVLSRAQSFSQPVASQTLTQQVRQFERRFQVADDTARVTASLLDLLQRFPTGGRQVHDANIVATMQAYGVARLLTHNVADFARFGRLITVIPLVASP